MGQSVRKRRFFTPDLPDEPGGLVELPAVEARHAAGVLRLSGGALVELFDGRGSVARGRIADVGRGRAAVTVLIDRVGRVERPGPRVQLAFAVPKGKRLDWLLEKAAELGAASLQPVLFERGVAGGVELSSQKRRRWLGHCVSAAAQCGLNHLPQIHEPMALAGFLAGSGDALDILGDCDEDSSPLAEVLAPLRPAENIRLLIGPEGGLTPAERAAAVDAGFKPARLGATTLRVETAAIGLLAVAMAIAQPGKVVPCERPGA